MSYFGKNIRKIRNVKKLSQQALAELFDLKRGTLGAYEEGRSEPKLETIIKIANHFSISIDDLLTTELTVNKLLKFKGDLSLQGNYQKEQFIKIPCITPSSEKDYIQYYNKSHFIEDLPTLQLPISSGKTFRGYLISNLEMTDQDKDLRPKDVVIGELVAEEDIDNLKDGSLVFILYRDKLVLRKYFRSDKTIILRATNDNIDDLTVELSEIKELWLVQYSFSKRSTDDNAEIKDKIAYLEQEFLKLKNRL